MLRSILLRRPTVALIIIKLNIIVFAMWFFSAAYGGVEFMIDNFLVSWTGVLQGRVWTLITSVFSHNMLFHILVNMYVFYGFATVLENVMGGKRFLRFYLTAGIVASFGHCFVSTVLLHEPSMPALGASGAVAGVVVLFSFVFPREKLLLFGIIPLPAWFAAILFVGMDAYGLVSQTRGSELPIGYGAHLGGAFYGVLYFLFKYRSRST